MLEGVRVLHRAAALGAAGKAALGDAGPEDDLSSLVASRGHVIAVRGGVRLGALDRDKLNQNDG
mgnify:CR=1 FL=1